MRFISEQRLDDGVLEREFTLGEIPGRAGHLVVGRVSFVISFTVRLLALYLGWKGPLAKEPAGVYQHSDGRPLLGSKIAGKSQWELHDLGLVVQNPAPAPASAARHKRLQVVL